MALAAEFVDFLVEERVDVSVDGGRAADRLRDEFITKIIYRRLDDVSDVLVQSIFDTLLRALATFETFSGEKLLYEFISNEVVENARTFVF